MYCTGTKTEERRGERGKMFAHCVILRQRLMALED